jgi:hypothetical protein
MSKNKKARLFKNGFIKWAGGKIDPNDPLVIKLLAEIRESQEKNKRQRPDPEIGKVIIGDTEDTGTTQTQTINIVIGIQDKR